MPGEYYRTNPRYPIFETYGGRRSHPDEVRDPIDKAIRELVDPQHKRITAAVAELVKDGQTIKPSIWKNPRRVLAGQQLVLLDAQNSNFENGELWFDHKEALGKESAREIAGTYQAGPSISAAFDRLKYPVLTKLDLTFDGLSDSTSEIIRQYREILGIDITKGRLTFDINNLYLLINADTRPIGYRFSGRSNKFHDVNVPSRLHPETIENNDFLKLLRTSVDQLPVFPTPLGS